MCVETLENCYTNYLVHVPANTYWAYASSTCVRVGVVYTTLTHQRNPQNYLLLHVCFIALTQRNAVIFGFGSVSVRFALFHILRFLWAFNRVYLIVFTSRFACITRQNNAVLLTSKSTAKRRLKSQKTSIFDPTTGTTTRKGIKAQPSGRDTLVFSLFLFHPLHVFISLPGLKAILPHSTCVVYKVKQLHGIEG